MNRVDLIGTLYKDVEVKQGTNGKSIAKTGIAVKREYKNAEGKYDADFLNITAFGATADFLSKYFSKGSKIALSGKIQTGSYKNKEDKTVYTTDIIADSIEFVDSKGNSKGGSAAPKADTNEFMDVTSDIEGELPFN